MCQLSASSLCVSYGRKGPCVLEDLSLQFTPSKLTALVGPNGCGKSTLLKALVGIIPCRSGQVTLDGADVSRLGRKAFAQRVAYLPQHLSCPDYLTVGDLIELGGYARTGPLSRPDRSTRARFELALEQVGLAGQAHIQVNELSGGQRQRAWIAMILAQDAEVLLFDEPVNHLDLTYQYKILEILRGLLSHKGRTVVTVLHDLNLAAAFADEIILMRDGKVTARGTPREALNPAYLSESFGLTARIADLGDRIVCLPDLDDMTTKVSS